jgi:sulfofructose kinase
MATVLCVGHAVQDFVFSVEKLPNTAEKYRASGFESVGGGPAATAAVAIARLGGQARLAARTGDDAIGDFIVSELEGYGVDCSLVGRLQLRKSSLSAVLVDEQGERLIVNYLDPLLEPNTESLPDELPDDVDVVLGDIRWPEGSQHLFKVARQGGVPAVLDADLPVPADGELVRTATHVAFSAPALADYTNDNDTESALRAVAATTDAWCCVTLGREGAMFIDNDEVCKVAAYDVPVGDTLGAGDVWHGAFALALAEGQSIIEAVTFASAAAALKVQNGGGRAGCATRIDVERFLRQRATENAK